jgi:hypothetical protein
VVKAAKGIVIDKAQVAEIKKKKKKVQGIKDLTVYRDVIRQNLLIYRS